MNVDTFGNLINQTGSSTGKLGFQSKYYDEESGLNYYYHRYYYPLIGRFINEDPIGLKGGLNLFKFANQNPLKFTDNFGLQACTKNEEEVYNDIMKNNIPTPSEYMNRIISKHISQPILSSDLLQNTLEITSNFSDFISPIIENTCCMPICLCKDRELIISIIQNTLEAGSLYALTIAVPGASIYVISAMESIGHTNTLLSLGGQFIRSINRCRKKCGL